MQELNYKLQLDYQGIEVHTEGEALDNNIQEWLDTPEGTVANNPSWGHNLKKFQFEPEGLETAILMEMAMVEKLPMDVKNLSLSGVRVTFTELDKCQVVIRHSYGTFNKTIAR